MADKGRLETKAGEALAGYDFTVTVTPEELSELQDMLAQIDRNIAAAQEHFQRIVDRA